MAVEDKTTADSIRHRMLVSKAGLGVFITELALVVAISIVWFSSPSVRASVSLWVLFIYSLPSQFLIAVAPHEPVFLFFSRHYEPLTITLVAVAGTVLTEVINYSVLKFVFDLGTVERLGKGKVVRQVVRLFDRAAFGALLIAGVTPIPFFPFRFLVVLDHYPWYRYALAVLISRGIRFYLLALFGNVVEVPNYVIAILFIGLAALASIPIARELLRRKPVIEENPEAE
jgi:membrane protein YqaA with SNARE-associated domain